MLRVAAAVATSFRGQVNADLRGGRIGPGESVDVRWAQAWMDPNSDELPVVWAGQTATHPGPGPADAKGIQVAQHVVAGYPNEPGHHVHISPAAERRNPRPPLPRAVARGSGGCQPVDQDVHEVITPAISTFPAPRFFGSVQTLSQNGAPLTPVAVLQFPDVAGAFGGDRRGDVDGPVGEPSRL